MKVIYDITVLGLHYSKTDNRTGIYRTVDFLLKGMVDRQELDIDCAHTSNWYFNKNSRQYLDDVHHGLSLVVEAGREKKLLPVSVFGRLYRYFKYAYKLLGIDIEKSQLSYERDKIEAYDVFHSPFFPIPASLKSQKSLIRIITIHDLIPVLFPDLHTQKKNMLETIESIGEDFVICVSDSTKRDLVKFSPDIDPEKVFVARWAAAPELFYKCNDIEKYRKLQEKYHLPEKYFLTLGTLEPRKNLDHLIRSFVKFLELHKIDDVSLVLVGSKGWMYESIFKEYKNSNELRDKIIFTGRVPDDDLATLYSNAHSFYYMSLYEGFGLPPLEAMQCGVATVTSNTSSLPEVVGDGGIMLDPKDQESLIQTMHNLNSDEDLRRKYQKLGLKQSSKFSWEECARRHVEIYQQIASWKD